MASNNNITPAQRMSLFNQSTRQNKHMLPTVSGTGGSQTLQMLLPKSRLLAKIMLKVTATVNAKHASKTTLKINPTKLVRRFSLDLNNGFSPFVVSGEELHLYNLLSVNSQIISQITTNDKSIKSSSAGTDNILDLYFELPCTLNERDAQGLILLQNAETSVTLSCDIGTAGDMPIEDATGFTLEIKDVKISACTETFSLPAVSEAFPDLSVLKLVNGVSHAFLGNGVNTVKLSTGTIYRKLIMKFEDEDGNPLRPEDFTSDIQLVFNQADINYSISADMLVHLNSIEINNSMPIGVYYLDFSSQGFTNFGGTRDLIDTELLTEFWLKFGTTKKGKVSIISECIARVK